MRIVVRGATDVGRARHANEDSHAWWIPEGEEEKYRRGILLVVADGMGGAQAGEQASLLAVQTVVEQYSIAAGEDPLSDLRQAVERANGVVFRQSRSRDEYAGMGTTCTAAVVLGCDLLLAHVGDSRTYLLNDQGIQPVTRDHSLVAEMVSRGQLTPEEVRIDPRRNVVTRAVGIGPSVEVDAERKRDILSPGDTLLLCSDGLHGVVEESEILRIVEGSSPDEACDALLD